MGLRLIQAPHTSHCPPGLSSGLHTRAGLAPPSPPPASSPLPHNLSCPLFCPPSPSPHTPSLALSLIGTHLEHALHMYTPNTCCGQHTTQHMHTDPRANKNAANILPLHCYLEQQQHNPKGDKELGPAALVATGAGGQPPAPHFMAWPQWALSSDHPSLGVQPAWAPQPLVQAPQPSTPPAIPTCLAPYRPHCEGVAGEHVLCVSPASPVGVSASLSF